MCIYIYIYIYTYDERALRQNTATPIIKITRIQEGGRVQLTEPSTFKILYYTYANE